MLFLISTVKFSAAAKMADLRVRGDGSVRGLAPGKSARTLAHSGSLPLISRGHQENTSHVFTWAEYLTHRPVSIPERQRGFRSRDK